MPNYCIGVKGWLFILFIQHPFVCVFLHAINTIQFNSIHSSSNLRVVRSQRVHRRLSQEKRSSVYSLFNVNSIEIMKCTTFCVFVRRLSLIFFIYIPGISNVRRSSFKICVIYDGYIKRTSDIPSFYHTCIQKIKGRTTNVERRTKDEHLIYLIYIKKKRMTNDEHI